MNNLRHNIVKTLAIVKQSLQDVLDEHGKVPRSGPKPKFSDAEVIALSLLSESLMYDSELYLFKMLHNNYQA